MAHHEEYHELPARRLESKPRGLLLVAGGGIVLGAILWAISVLGGGENTERAWRAYTYNWLYWTSIAQGAVLFGAALVVTGARWARPIRRLTLSGLFFLPLAWLLMIPIFLAAGHIFPWAAHPETLHHPQDLWMKVPFATGRNLVLFGLLVVVSYVFAFFALRPDAALARDRGMRHAMFDRLTRSWRGQEVEEAHSARRMARIAPVLGLLYAFAMSFIAYDMVMALEPHFLSTLIGPYFFMGAFLGGVALTGLLAVLTRRGMGLEEFITPVHLHDVAKLTFAFCVFWAYMFWAQYIVIWYGKLIPEQTFLIHRMSPPYGPLAFIVFLGLWVLPFFGLLGVKPKKTPAIYATFTVIILVTLWIERYVLTYPSMYPNADGIPFGLAEIGATLLFGGLFVGAVLMFLGTFPVLQMWQPPSEPHPDLLEDPRQHAPMPQVTEP